MGVAAALSGCVSVSPDSGSAPSPAAGDSSRKPVPLVVEERPREALESTAPVAVPSPRPVAVRPRADEGGAKGAEARPRARLTVRPAAPVPVPVPMRSAVGVPDVCGLVERHGAWRPGGAGPFPCRGAARR